MIDALGNKTDYIQKWTVQVGDGATSLGTVTIDRTTYEIMNVGYRIEQPTIPGAPFRHVIQFYLANGAASELYFISSQTLASG